MHDTTRLRPDGFRERGNDVTRLEAFVDAAFAFALTMLVISVGAIPDTIPKLVDALKGTPAFAMSFVLVARFWYEHMSWSRRYGLDDRGSILLSLVLVFLVMVYIYPLKVMCATFFGWISGGWLPMGFGLHTVSDLRVMFTVFGVVYGTMSIVISLLYLQAWTQRDALDLSIDERIATLQKILFGPVSAGVAVLSVIAAFNLPEHGSGWIMGMPGMVYALMPLSSLLPAWIGRRVRRRWLEAGSA
jgi:uncharacterized membrane protein